jgi:putative flavoprotein involved in K+ transport
MRLYGRLVGATGAALRFAPDLAKNPDHADAVSESIKESIDSYIDAHHIDAPPERAIRRCGHPGRSPPS